MDSGKIIKNKGKVFIFTIMETEQRVSGKMVGKMENILIYIIKVVKNIYIMMKVL